MPIITLQHGLLLDNSTKSQKLLLFVQAVHESLTQGITSRLVTNKLKSWNDIKSNYPHIINTVNAEITAIALGYFRSYKHELKALSSMHKIEFNLKEAEVLESSNINEIDKLKIAVYFLSDPILLVASFGSYMLLADQNDKAHTSTFMLELSGDLTINSYQ